MTWRKGGAPVRPQPSERLRVVWPQPQDREGHRDQGMQVEGTGLGDPDLADRGFVLRPHRVAQLIGQDAGAGDADRALQEGIVLVVS